MALRAVVPFYIRDQTLEIGVIKAELSARLEQALKLALGRGLAVGVTESVLHDTAERCQVGEIDVIIFADQGVHLIQREAFKASGGIVQLVLRIREPLRVSRYFHAQLG